MLLTESPDITTSAAIAAVRGEVVLILRAGLLSPTDVALLRVLLGCVAATVGPPDLSILGIGTG